MGDTKAQQVALLGVWGNSRRAVTTTYTVALLDKGWTIACGGGASYTVTLNAASGYDSDFQVVILNEDASQNKTISPNGLSSFTLGSGQACLVFNDNGTWSVFVGGNAGAWIGYTPAVTSTSGTGLTATTSGVYQVAGKTVFFRINITITAMGTAGGRMLVTLPITPLNSNANYSLLCSGVNQSSHKGVLGQIFDDLNKISLALYDSSFPGVLNDTINFAGFYEAA